MGQSNDKPQKFYSFQKKEEPKKDQPPTDLKTKVRITITLDNTYQEYVILSQMAGQVNGYVVDDESVTDLTDYSER